MIRLQADLVVGGRREIDHGKDGLPTVDEDLDGRPVEKRMDPNVVARLPEGCRLEFGKDRIEVNSARCRAIDFVTMIGLIQTKRRVLTLSIRKHQLHAIRASGV